MRPFVKHQSLITLLPRTSRQCHHPERMAITQPGVARHELPWEHASETAVYPERVASASAQTGGPVEIRPRSSRTALPQRSLALLFLSVAMAVESATTQGPDTGPVNHVLELDGTGSYVELPANIFNDLTQATVEAWVRWDDFSGAVKRVFNYGDALRDISIMSGQRSDTDLGQLQFAVCDGQQRTPQSVEVRDVLRAHRWCHVAAVPAA